MLDRDPLRDEVFPDHVDEVFTFGVLRCGSGGEAVRTKIRVPAKLIDPLATAIIWACSSLACWANSALTPSDEIPVAAMACCV